MCKNHQIVTGFRSMNESWRKVDASHCERPGKALIKMYRQLWLSAKNWKFHAMKLTFGNIKESY